MASSFYRTRCFGADCLRALVEPIMQTSQQALTKQQRKTAPLKKNTNRVLGHMPQGDSVALCVAVIHNCDIFQILGYLKNYHLC